MAKRNNYQKDIIEDQALTIQFTDYAKICSLPFEANKQLVASLKVHHWLMLLKQTASRPMLH
jgi:hypothetical protein